MSTDLLIVLMLIGLVVVGSLFIWFIISLGKRGLDDQQW